MELTLDESNRCIERLAQAVPFRFVDRVRYLDGAHVVTELHTQSMPERFADAASVDAYAVLEFAAQSSGLILRGRKKEGARGLIASFRSVQWKTHDALCFPLSLESRLVDERWMLFEFDFQVHSGTELAVIGSIGIVIGR